MQAPNTEWGKLKSATFNQCLAVSQKRHNEGHRCHRGISMSTKICSHMNLNASLACNCDLSKLKDVQW